MISLIGKRKTATPPLVKGGNQPRGVLTSDAAGRPSVIPFVSGGTNFLREDGTMAAASGGGGAVMVYDAVLGAYVVEV